MNVSKIKLFSLTTAATFTFCGISALAQYDSMGFEPLDASADGVLLTGQDGYYIPDGTVSVDFYAYTYTDNVLGVPANPDGENQFVAGVGPGGGAYARAQRESPWGSGVWELSYDVCAFYLGVPPSSDNIGSFSVQPYPGSASYINLFSWEDINTADAWRVSYYAYQEDGTIMTLPGEFAGDAWHNLTLSHWYRLGTLLDFDSNRIIQVSITDIITGDSAVYNPTTWYMEGGSGGSTEPTGFRLFAGGGNADNGVAWDNATIAPGVAPFMLALGGSCTDLINVDIMGGVPGAKCAFAYGSVAGSTPVPPCPGLTVDINRADAWRSYPDDVLFINLNAQGAFSFQKTGGPAFCGKLVQVVDLDNCAKTNVDVVK